MDKTQIIKQEIERRFDDNMKASEQYTENSKSRALFTPAAKEDYDLLAFIDSIPEEPASEDLDDAARDYSLVIFRQNGVDMECVGSDSVSAFKAGAEWQKQQMMKDAVEGLVCGHNDNTPAWIDLSIKNKPNVNVGNKVKIIIVKEK